MLTASSPSILPFVRINSLFKISYISWSSSVDNALVVKFLGLNIAGLKGANIKLTLAEYMLGFLPAAKSSLVIGSKVVSVLLSSLVVILPNNLIIPSIVWPSLSLPVTDIFLVMLPSGSTPAPIASRTSSIVRFSFCERASLPTPLVSLPSL